MKKQEFLDLLSFYLQKLPKTVVDEIVAEYRAHFEEGMAHGKAEEEISRDLGSPREIAKEYLYDDEEENPNRFKTGMFRTKEGSLNWALIVLAILLFPIWGPLLLSGFAVLFSLVVTLIALVVAFIFAGGAILTATLFPSLPWIHAGGGFLMLSPVTRVLWSCANLALGIVLVRLIVTLFTSLYRKIKEAYGTYQWKRSRS